MHPSAGLLAAGARLSVAVVVTLLVVTALRYVGGAVVPAQAVQPYAPRGLAVTQVASSDWFALSMRASGFRPNSTVLVDVDGTDQRSMAVDAAGVVDLRVDLPDRIGVQIRGVALEGGSLDLRQEVELARPGSGVRDLVLVAAGLLLAVGAVVGPRIRTRSRGAAPTGSGPVALPEPR